MFHSFVELSLFEISLGFAALGVSAWWWVHRYGRTEYTPEEDEVDV